MLMAVIGISYQAAFAGSGAAVEDTMPTVLGDPARAVIIHGGKRAGDVVVVDLATSKVTTHPDRRCTKK